MENQLLEWATKNTRSSQRQTSVPNQPIDTKWLDIMMGKKDAVEMKSTIEKVMDIQTPDKEKVALLDYLENLVESLDNANDLKILGLYPPLIELYTNKTGQHANDESVRMHAIWILGTAIQNNEKSSLDFINSEGIESLIYSLTNEHSEKVLQKTIRCCSLFVQSPIPILQTHLPTILSLLYTKLSQTTIISGEFGVASRILFFLNKLVDREDSAKIVVDALVEAKIFGWTLDYLSGQVDKKDSDELSVEFIELSLKLWTNVIKTLGYSVISPYQYELIAKLTTLKQLDESEYLETLKNINK